MSRSTVSAVAELIIMLLQTLSGYHRLPDSKDKPILDHCSRVFRVSHVFLFYDFDLSAYANGDGCISVVLSALYCTFVTTLRRTSFL